MRLTVLLSLLFVTTAVGNGVSQNRVNMQLGRTTVKEALMEFQRQVSKVVVFSDDSFSTDRRVRADFKDTEQETFLAAILAGSGMTYRITDEYILIMPEKTTARQQPERVAIEGTVKDEAGRPIPGVTVQLKGTTTGAATDAEGRFRFSFTPAAQSVLLFSYIGKKSMEIAYTGQTVVNVTMEEDVEKIDDVVVTGFQVVDKRVLTSAVSTIKAEDLDKMGVLTVDQMLEGKTAGLMITNLASQPGAASKVRVRASGTFTGSREPLWVIDGIIYEDPVPLSAADINSFDNVNLIGNAITGLNPQDIESINILKDASATAVYGTRAANGVIVVTTKRGKEGPAVVSYTGSVNIVDRPRYTNFDLMNSKERVDVSREIYERGLEFPGNSFTTSLQTPLGYEKALMDYWKHGDYGVFQKEVSRLESLNFDWFGELYRPAINHTHSVNVSGGTDNVRYYFSVGYDNQRGTEKGVDLNRITARSNIDVKLRRNVLLSFGMDGSVQKAKYNRTQESVFNMPYIFDEAYYTSRAVEARDPDGNLVYVDKIVMDSENYGKPNEYGRYNILHEMDGYENNVQNKAFNFNVGLEWEIIRNLKFNSRFSYRNTTNLREEWVDEDTYYVATLRSYDEFRNDLDAAYVRSKSLAPFGGLYSGGQVSQEAMSIRNQVNYLKAIGDKHIFNLNITQEATTTKYRGATNWTAPGYNHTQGRKFISLPEIDLKYDEQGEYTYQAMLKWFTGQANGLSIYPTITDRTQNVMSWVGILTYSYDNRYIGNLNLRSDGSNTFGQYERYKFRPAWSASARWNIHEEFFLRDVMQINELALRASYGFRGTPPNASPYLTLVNYGHNNSSYYPENTASLGDFPNANLKWETTKTLNTGLSFSFFDNRLSGTFDYAYSRSDDLLLTRPISLVNGTSYELYNGGSKEDHTIELDLHGLVLKTKEWRWNVNFNYTHIKENVLKGTNVYAGGVSVQNFLNISGRELILKGFPVDGFYSYRFGGLDDNGAPTFPALGNEYATEYDRLQDLLVYEGTKVPKTYGGFGTQVSFKGFTLTSNFTYKAGYKVRLLSLYPNGIYVPLPNENMRGEFADRWRQPGDRTNIPALSDDPMKIDMPYGAANLLLPYGDGSTLYQLYDLSDERTAKGDHIRWQSLALSYNCPKRWISAIGMRSMTIRFQVQNLAVWTFDGKLKGQDPEQVSQIGMPSLTSYNIGINIGF